MLTKSSSSDSSSSGDQTEEDCLFDLYHGVLVRGSFWDFVCSAVWYDCDEWEFFDFETSEIKRKQ